MIELGVAPIQREYLVPVRANIRLGVSFSALTAPGAR